MLGDCSGVLVSDYAVLSAPTSPTLAVSSPECNPPPGFEVPMEVVADRTEQVDVDADGTEPEADVEAEVKNYCSSSEDCT